MEHHFDIDVACEVGVIPAIIYNNIQHWCIHNRANNINYHDGLYWTFNSVKAVQELFPYLSIKQVRDAISKLEKAEYIKTGNYNKLAFDHTKWYADLRLPAIAKEDNAICPMGQMESPSESNGVATQGNAIPNINTDNKPTDINTDSKKERKTTTFDAILDSVDYIREDEELRETYTEFIKMRKLIKKPLTDFALKKIINEAHKLADGDVDTIKAIIEQSVMNSWQGVYALKTVNKKFSDTKPYTPNTYTNPYDDENL